MKWEKKTVECLHARLAWLGPLLIRRRSSLSLANLWKFTDLPLTQSLGMGQMAARRDTRDTSTRLSLHDFVTQSFTKFNWLLPLSLSHPLRFRYEHQVQLRPSIWLVSLASFSSSGHSVFGWTRSSTLSNRNDSSSFNYAHSFFCSFFSLAR